MGKLPLYLCTLAALAVMSVACKDRSMSDDVIVKNDVYSVSTDSVVQGNYVAVALSPLAIESNYRSSGDVADDVSRSWRIDAPNENFPLFDSPYTLVDALYNMAIDNIVRCQRPDGTYRAGVE